MDSQQHDASKSVSLFGDPFSTVPFANAPSNSATPLAVTNRLVTPHTNTPFNLASPSPSTPARVTPFNPDDFLVSPPHPPPRLGGTPTHRATPELKRRLFAQGEPSATPLNAIVHTSGATTTPISAPLPFVSVSDAIITSPNVSFTFSPPRAPFLSELLSATAPQLTDSSDPTSLIKSEAARARTTPVLSAPAPGVQPLDGGLQLADHFLTPAQLEAVNASALPEVSARPTLTARALKRTTRPADSVFAPAAPMLAIPLPTTPFTPGVTTSKVKCSCKASRCLKLYCLCFANSGFCSEGCSCKNCHNTAAVPDVVREARETVLARDPRAFDPKVRLSLVGGSAAGRPAGGSGDGRPADSCRNDIHAKGCNCRKGCSKKYCVCRELRVECGPRCTCSGPQGCQNRSGASGGLAKVGSSVAVGTGVVDGLGALGDVGAFAAGEDLETAGRTARRKVRKRARNEDVVAERPDDGLPDDGLAAGASEHARDKRVRKIGDGLEGLDSVDGLEGCAFGVAANVARRGVLLAHDAHKLSAGDEFGVKRRVGTGEVVSHVVEEVLRRVDRHDGDCAHTRGGGASADVAGGSIVGGSIVGGGGGSDGSTHVTRPAETGRVSGVGDGVSLFGRESDGIEVCRLPRILRVKMGTGRLYSKFGV